jgi:pimeloyl-ACP methyl ester carboxylesterase
VDIVTGDIRLHTVQAGPPDGRLLIFLHGFPEFWYGWKAQIPYFAMRGWRVIAPDQRGYNLSDKPKGIENYSVENLAGDIASLISALGREKAWLVGHDWGAAVAWETALRYPEKLARLAILNVPHPDVMTRFILGDAEQRRRSWYIFYFQLPWLPEWSFRRNQYAGGKQALMSSASPNTFSDADLHAYIAAWNRPGALTAMLSWYRAAFRRGFSGSWNPRKLVQRRAHVPTLILWGKQDFALTYRMVAPSLDLCDQGRAIFFENTSHWVQHEQAAAVNQSLSEFFEE